MQRRYGKPLAVVGLLMAATLLLAACGSSSSSSGSGSGSSASASGGPSCAAASQKYSGTLNGSGSTFQLSFQQSAISCFETVQPNMTVNYGGGGSGKGRTDLASRVVDFAGSDSTISSSEQSSFHGTVLYFPVVIGPISLSYNLSGVNNLKLTGPVIAKIFQGQITSWNNSAIKQLNPGVNLPSTNITVVRRSDSSGTTQNFSQFLVDAAPGVWTLGTASTIDWPASTVGGNGNGGVASVILKTPGAIGYVDYSDAVASKLHFAAVKNMAGHFILPSVEAATAAADHASIKPDLTFSAIWAPGAGSYPITYQSWVLVYQSQSAAKAKLLKAWIGFLVGEGQELLPSLHFAPLPAGLRAKAQAQVKKIGTSG